MKTIRIEYSSYNTDCLLPVTCSKEEKDNAALCAVLSFLKSVHLFSSLRIVSERSIEIDYEDEANSILAVKQFANKGTLGIFAESLSAN